MRIIKLSISFVFILSLTIGILFSEKGKTISTSSAQNLIQENVSKITQPTIISRKDWNAKNPIGEGKEHQISFITIHHTATLQKKEVSIEKKMQNLQSFSQREDKLASGKLKPAWFDIPYHYYIAVDGKIAEGREINFAGDTNTEYDPTGHALIVLEGNFETEQVTDEQKKSLEQMVIWLADKYKVSSDKIKGHDDFAKTACPGKNLKAILPNLSKSHGRITENISKGILTGQIIDCFGDIVKNAKINIKNEKIRRQLNSDKNGLFMIRLPEGKYKIVIEKCGFKKLSMVNVEINKDSKKIINLSLEYHLATHESNACNPQNKICKSSNK